MQSIEDTRKAMTDHIRYRISDFRDVTDKKEAMAFIHEIKGLLSAMTATKIFDLKDPIINQLYEEFGQIREEVGRKVGES